MKLSPIFTKQIQVARVYGIPVRIDLRWFFVFALSVWLLAANFEQGKVWSRIRVDAFTAWIIGTITTLAFFLSIFGHELAHALMARAEGIEIVEIVLHPFGGLARLRREPDNPRAEFRIAIVGPAASFLFALPAFGAMSIAVMGQYWTAADVFLITGFGNLLVALFNLFPGYPLDGGRVLRAWLWHRSNNLAEATRFTSYSGQLIAWALIVFGLYMVLARADLMTGVWSVLVGLFLRGAAASVMNEVRGAKPQTVADAMAAPVAIEPDTLVSYFIDTILPLHRQRAVLVAHQRRLHGILTLEDLQRVPRNEWRRTQARDVMRPVTAGLFVEPSTSLVHAERLMQQNGAGALAVINSAGELIGFLQRGQLKRHTST